MLLDLRPGAGGLLGPCWEYDPAWLGPPGRLNTSECPKGAVGSETCPSTFFVCISHLLDDPDLVQEEAGALTSQTGARPGNTQSWQEYDPAWLGPPGRLNTSECPKGAVGSSLSQILLDTVPSKYYLSRKACLGILRRAKERGLLCIPRIQAISAVSLLRQKSLHIGHSCQRTVIRRPRLELERLLQLRRQECELLQGFPPGWTDLPGASDSARYKALGNSVAVPCVEYLMQG